MITIRAMVLGDYASAFALWEVTEGIGLSQSDTREAIALFLAQNPDLSAVAIDAEGALVGAVLCGHDGRRGCLYHVAVAASFRRRGIARALLERCFAKLAEAGIDKCNLFLYADNAAGAAFWEHNGWTRREDLRVFQRWVAPQR
jgi:N-acetylglutamate synthase